MQQPGNKKGRTPEPSFAWLWCGLALTIAAAAPLPVSELRAAPKARSSTHERTHASVRSKARRHRARARARRVATRRAIPPARRLSGTRVKPAATQPARRSTNAPPRPAPTTAGISGASPLAGRGLWAVVISLGTLGLAILAVVGGLLQRRGKLPFFKAGPNRSETLGLALEERLLEPLRQENNPPPAHGQGAPPADRLLRECLRAEKQFYVLPNRPELAGALAAQITRRLVVTTAAPERLEGALRGLLDYAIRRSGGAGVDFSVSERTLAIQITGSGALWKEHVERRLPQNLLDRLDQAGAEFDESIRDERGNRLLLIRTL